MSPHLTLENVSHAYGSQQVLDEINLVVGDGVTALVGVNGAGKSTLLMIMAGALRHAKGSVFAGGIDLFARRTRARALGKVALMPQSATFPSNMTAHEVVTYTTWMRGSSARVARLRASEALDQVLLGDRANSKIHALSGGMRRRVCLAQAIAAKSEVLLLDEPSTGLDPEQRRIMVELLGQLPGAVLLSSHVMEDVADLASRVLILDQGGLAFDGTVEDLRQRAPDASDARALEAGFLTVLMRSRS